MMKTIMNEDNIDEMEIKNIFNLIKKEIIFNKDYIEIDVDLIREINYKISDLLIQNPFTTIPLFEKALTTFLEKKEIRFKNIGNRINIRDLRVDNLNKFISTKGILKRITKVIPRVINIGYECPSCGTTISVPQISKKRREPTKCSCGRKGSFRLKNEEIKNIQELNLEEIPEELDGKQPNQLRVYIEGTLTEETFSNKLQPGKKIEVIGTITRLPAFMDAKDEQTNLSEFMINTNNIITLEEEDDIILDDEDLMQIKEIASNNPLKVLSDSLVPEIYGNEEIKEAIILQAVKGVARERSDGTFSREDIHILLCGDPGVSKSVTLKATINKIPKSRMVVGTKTSKVGLGAMAVKDELTSSWSLECGALVLSSGSLLCIDELDKMYKENLSELLEPMSSGTVTINKAGISAKLSSRTSILASANPIQGNFNLQQHLAKQLDLPSPILNRFDLIFIMLDRPNKDFDSSSVDHVFGSLTKKRTSEIPKKLFKKYIFYCRKLKPKINEELLTPLKEFYMALRQRSNKDSEIGLPINLRNLEGLIRLSEAHAKLRLSESVEKEDFDVAKRIFMYCLKQIGIDNETGMIDMSRPIQKIPISKRGKLSTLLELINNLSENFGELVPYPEIVEEAKKFGIKKWELDDFLEELKRVGKIFEPKRGVIQILK